MPERVLGPGQKEALKKLSLLLVDPEMNGIVSIASQDLHEVYSLPLDEAPITMAVLGLVFANIKGVKINPKDRRRLCSTIINGPAGSRQAWEVEHGVRHPRKGRSPTGRNRSGRRDSQR